MKKLLENLKLNHYYRPLVIPMFIFTLVLYVHQIVYMFKYRDTLDFTIAIGITIGALLLVGYAMTFVFDWLKKLPSSIVLYLGTSIFMLFQLFNSNRTPNSNLIVIGSLLVFFIIIGLIVVQIRTKKYLKWYILLPEALLVMTSGFLIFMMLFWHGIDNDIDHVAFETFKTDKSLFEIAVQGGYHHGVYGNEAYLDKYQNLEGLESETTSISYFLKKWKKSRESHLGFNVYDVPLNGQYFIPDGPGQYPLVLVVHGNHEMTHDSETGYEYLGSYLAERGYIVVSVDENFLNYSTFDTGLLKDSIGSENDARAYVMLQHVAFLLEENTRSQSIFYNKIDSDNIALIGHSRGGEAVAIARFFNEIKYLPNDYNKTFKNDFEIKSLVAIAPTDKQYKPGGRPAELKDVNYLLLHGAQDMDVTYMTGLNQYERISYTGHVDAFKSAVYIYGANHGYFNENWLRGDTSPMSSLLHNTEQLMTRQKQEIIAKQLISYFLEATLKDDSDYQEGFVNYKAFEDLPSNVYVTQYLDSKSQVIADFSEDSYLETATDGSTIKAFGLSKWSEGTSKMDGKTSEIFGAYLSWFKEARLDFSKNYYELTNDDMIYLTLADDSKDDDLIDLKIRLTDKTGQTRQVDLSYYGMLQHQLEIDIPKVPWFEDINNKELAMQTFVLPVKAFSSNDSFDISSVTSISLVLNQGDTRSIFLKEIGIRQAD